MITKDDIGEVFGYINQHPSNKYKPYYDAIENAFIVYEIGLPTGDAKKDLNTLLCYVSELERQL